MLIIVVWWLLYCCWVEPLPIVVLIVVLIVDDWFGDYCLLVLLTVTLLVVIIVDIVVGVGALPRLLGLLLLRVCWCVTIDHWLLHYWLDDCCYCYLVVMELVVIVMIVIDPTLLWCHYVVDQFIVPDIVGDFVICWPWNWCWITLLLLLWCCYCWYERTDLIDVTVTVVDPLLIGDYCWWRWLMLLTWCIDCGEVIVDYCYWRYCCCWWLARIVERLLLWIIVVIWTLLMLLRYWRPGLTCIIDDVGVIDELVYVGNLVVCYWLGDDGGCWANWTLLLWWR